MFVCKTLLVLAVGFMQLASEPSADELLVQTLVELDELDQTHCAGFAGAYSGIVDDMPKILEICGISAKNEKRIEFHSYGTQMSRVVGSVHSDQMIFFDVLRDNRNFRKRFRMGNAGQMARGSVPDQIWEEEDKSTGQKTIWPLPEIDPVGMVFGSESRLQSRNSEFEHVRDELIRKFEFQKSRLLKNRNTEGTWLSLPDKNIRMTIEFDRKQKNLPVVVKKEQVAERRIIGLAKTTWVKYEKDRLVPETMSIASERANGSTVQIDLRWEWVPLDRWRSWSDENFEGLFNTEVTDLRTPFLVLFEPEKKTARREPERK